MSTPILDITELANGQVDQYLTANEAFRLLEAAGNDYEAVDLSTSDAALTSVQLVQHAMFMTSGNTVARTLTVPASKRLFLVSNGGSAELTVAVGATSIAVGAGTAGLFYGDGTADGLISIAGGGSGDVQSVNGQTGVVVLNLREVLTSPRAYYVRTDGNDSNDGLTDSAGGAFLTIQAAVDAAAALDTVIYDVTINVGAGTYDLGGGGVTLKSAMGAGAIYITGDTTTPANVSLTLTGAATGEGAIFGGVGLTTLYVIQGIKCSATATGTTFAIKVSGGGQVQFGSCEFGTGLTQQLRAEQYGILRGIGPYTISGGGTIHWAAVAGHIRVQNTTITITGTPAFGAFVNANGGALVIVNGLMFSGGATGVRYIVAENGVINTIGGGATYLPGDAAGSESTGGIYA